VKLSIGIDPGINGGIAAIEPGTLKVIRLADCPTVRVGKGQDYDIVGMGDLLRQVCIPGAVVTLERAQAMSKGGMVQGTVSMFSFGMGYGIWLGLLGGLGIPYRTVRPATWTGALLRGMTGDGKARAIRLAMTMFPGAALVPQGCRKPRDGRADALCLAYYGSKL
jgi:crossover junction endodeoxyribonuclease RuvC